MKLKILISWAVPLVVALAVISAQAQDKKPNIVVIMGDDVGMWNIGAYHRDDGRADT
jgi:arylsulfatase